MVKVAFENTITNGELLNLEKLKARTTLKEVVVRKLQFADDGAHFY